MSHSKRVRWTREKVLAAYEDYLNEPDTAVSVIAKRHGMYDTAQLLELADKFGLRETEIRICPQCGMEYRPERREEFCSQACKAGWERDTCQKKQTTPKKKLKKGERFCGYAEIVKINAEAQKAKMSYGQYVARRGL